MTTKWADESERQRKDLQSVWISSKYMQRKLVLVLSLGKEKSTAGTLTSVCGHSWKISLSVGTSLVD